MKVEGRDDPLVRLTSTPHPVQATRSAVVCRWRVATQRLAPEGSWALRPPSCISSTRPGGTHGTSGPAPEDL
jgi:hypothetical protein